jgi:ribonuclease E
MWESVRELTLRSTAPSLVYEEGSLIKRSIRDLYGKEVEEVVVAGDDGYREARDYMKMLLPNQVRNVRHWREPQPLFAKSGVEQQLDSMFSNVVTLKSGGYIVINQTEALVAIDVNSGRSTREHNIEDTALRTNLEAADEVARQLRLRDLAGLIVVDFIDMDEHRNNRSVERRIKEALKSDRARIQVGRISHFGLLEMSRQRMRTGVLEGSSVICQHCLGAGTVRSTASIALHVLRLVEDALVRSNAYNLVIRTRSAVALYILNHKREHLRDLEERLGVTLLIEADDTLTGSVYHAIERGEPASAPAFAPKPRQVMIDSISPWDDSDAPEAPVARAPVIDEADDDEEEEVETGVDAGAEEPGEQAEGPRDENGNRRKRRRRRGRGRDREDSGVDASAPQPPDDGLAIIGSLTRGLPAVEKDPETIGDEPDGESTEQETAAGEGVENGDPRRSRRRRRPRRDRDFSDRPGQQHQAEGQAEGGPADGAADASASAPSLETGEPATQPAPAPYVPAVAVEPSYQNGGWVVARAVSPESASTVSDGAPEASAPLRKRPLQTPPPPPASQAPEPVVPSSAPTPVDATQQAEAQRVEAERAEAERVEAAHQEAERKRAIELLPEAPPPQEKKTGWWSRLRNQGG